MSEEKDEVFYDVFCEVCGQHVAYYIGKPSFPKVCSTCKRMPAVLFVGNTNPATPAEFLRYDGFID